MSFTFDANGALDYVNAAWMLRTRRSIGDGLTRDAMWNDLLATNESESFLQSLASAITNNAAFRGEGTLQATTGNKPGSLAHGQRRAGACA
jgi:hypothetical protein